MKEIKILRSKDILPPIRSGHAGCLIHLKKSLICRRHRNSSAMVKAVSAKSLVKLMRGLIGRSASDGPAQEAKNSRKE